MEDVDNLLEGVEPQTIETPEKDNSQAEVVALRHAQQLEGSRMEAERLKSIAIDEATRNASVESLVELSKKDPKLADEVAKRFNYGSLKDLVRANTKQEDQKSLTEDDIEKIVSEREAKKEHERSLKKASKVIEELPKGLQEIAQARFDKITNGKTLNEEDALEFAEMATLYAKKDTINEAKGNEALEQVASTGAGNSKKSDKPDNRVRRGGQWVNLSTTN